MFDGEIVKKKFPLKILYNYTFKKNFGLRKLLVQDRVQDKVGLENFHQQFFFAKSLKMSCLMEKL